MRARDEFKNLIPTPDVNPTDINNVPGVDYAKTIEQIPPTYVPCKPGETICVACGKVITEKDLSDDPQRRAYQLKNRLHNACDEAKDRMLDIKTGVDPDRHRKAAEAEAKRIAARKLPDKYDKNIKF